MSGSNRGIKFALIGLTAFAFGLIVAPLFYAEQYHEKAVAAQQRGTPPDNRPQQSDTERSGIPGFLETQISNPEPDGETEKERRDLAAQETAAVGSLWAAMAATAGTLITFIGTILLYKQIKLTREAVRDTGDATKAMNDANAIAREASAPRVIVSLGNFDKKIGTSIADFVAFDVIATNVGGSGCVIEGVFHSFGTAGQFPRAFTGHHCVVPAPIGDSVEIDPISIPRSNVLQTPILRGYVHLSGPFLTQSERIQRFCFHVFPEISFPHLSHYRRSGEDDWFNGKSGICTADDDTGDRKQ